MQICLHNISIEFLLSMAQLNYSFSELYPFSIFFCNKAKTVIYIKSASKQDFLNIQTVVNDIYLIDIEYWILNNKCNNLNKIQYGGDFQNSRQNG